MKRESLSFKVLGALLTRGPSTPQLAAMTAFGNESRGASVILSHLRARGLVECTSNGRSGRAPGIWRITPLGEKALTEPPELIAQRGDKRDTKADLAAIRKRYKSAHAVHVEIQRIMGVPESLINAALMERGALTRGTAEAA